MADPHFPAHIRAALDQFAVPPLPDGFADRLIARVETVDQPALPKLRPERPNGTRWRRSGFIAGSVGLFGMVTAAAAATGFFGEPIYVPVVSEALAKANVTPMPKTAKAKPRLVRPTPVAVAKETETPPEIPTSVTVIVDGKAEATKLIQTLWQDPEFRKLPKEERQAKMRQKLRGAMDGGQFTREELRAAMQTAQAQRADRRAQREAARQAFGLPEKPQRNRADNAPADANPEASDANASPPKPRKTLRERLQEATPEERARILERVKARRAAKQAAQNPVDPETPPMSAPVAEPPK